MGNKPGRLPNDHFTGRRSSCALLAPAVSLWLSKLAKHVALLVCLMIIDASGGRLGIGQLGLFLLVVFAAVVHSVARTLQRRSALRLCRETS